MNERMRRQLVNDVRWTIEKSMTSATLYRPTETNVDSFYGSHETTETNMGTLAIEMKPLAPKDLMEVGADQAASVLPDSGVKENDILEVEGVKYRVTNVKKQNCFGAITHLDLLLELDKREVADA